MSDGERGFGRLPATDDRHLQRFSLTPDTFPTEPSPVVFGINWRDGWSRDQLVEKDRGIWLPPRAKWGGIAGGHAICSEPPELRDLAEWWRAFDQGNTPRCVDWAVCRQQSLSNRRFQQPGHIYPLAQQIDEWPGEDYDGTSVRAGEEVCRTVGMWRAYRGAPRGPFPEDGISVYRWARDVTDIAMCLSPDDNGARIFDRGYVTLLNSWGVFFPHRLRVPLEDIELLVFGEEGDAAVATDR